MNAESRAEAEQADVFKSRVHAGRLRLLPDATEFYYLPEYLERSLPPVASTLPLSDEPTLTTRRSVPPFFAGLLPEGRRLTALRQEKKISADDEFSLLLAIGGDTVGDVQVLQLGEVPNGTPRAVELSPPDDVDFDRLAGMTTADRVGLAGVQDKVSGKMISLPVMSKDREYILKLNPPEFPNVVENEAYFLALARRCGLKTVDAQIVHDQHERSGLLVTRFDRIEQDGVMRRLAVEDGCQCLGFWPADKYHATSEELFAAVAGRCSSEPFARRELYKQWLFALITGNGDLHAKNVSVLWRDGLTTVAPAYDVPSTVPYGDTTLALPAAGKTSGFSRRQVLEFARSIGVQPRFAEEALDQQLKATESLESELGSGAVPLDVTRLSMTIKQLRNRRQLLM